MRWLPLGVEWMLPWYGTWLVAWLPFVRARALQIGVVAYTAGLPWLYAPDANQFDAGWNPARSMALIRKSTGS